MPDLLGFLLCVGSLLGIATASVVWALFDAAGRGLQDWEDWE